MSSVVDINMDAKSSRKNNCHDVKFTIENNVLKGKVVPCTLHYSSVGQLLFDRLKNNPDVVEQVHWITEEEVTLADIADRAIKCALWMQKQGVMKGDIVTIVTHNHRDAFIPCLAAFFLGAVFNSWDHEMNIQRTRYFMNLTEPKVIFANEQSIGVVLETAKLERSHVKVVCFGNYPCTISYSEVLSGHDKAAVANFRCTDIDDPSHTATILFSSGTTGLPKGVEMSHRAWLTLLEYTDVATMKGTIWLWFQYPCLIGGVFQNLGNIYSCTKKIMGPHYSEKATCEIIEKFKVSRMLLGTSMVDRFVRYNSLSNYDLSSLKLLYPVGTALNRESLDLLKKHLPHTTIIQAYGMTEACGIAATQSQDVTTGSCGVVLPNCEIKIIDPETGKSLGPNQNGELCVKTPTMMSGYYRNPEATKDIIDAEGFLHSGDLAYYNDKGEIFVIDRLKELIKYRGRHLTPSEIEILLQSHPAVLEAAVVGIPHPTDNEHPVAFVSKVQNMEVTAQELIDLVANNLMSHCKLRGGVKFMPSLPRTSSGKISRVELKAIAKTLSVDAITEEEDTFADMVDRAIKCALWMQKQGVMKGDIVAVSTHNHLDSVIPCIAALFLGAAVNPWDCGMNTQLACHFMSLTEPKVIFANEQSIGVVLEAAKIERSPVKVVCFGDYPRTISFSEVLSGHNNSAVTNFRCTEINDPHQTATILFTSGTTGLPKGMQLSHRAWHVLTDVNCATTVNMGTRLWFSPLCWFSGVVLTLSCLVSCTKIIICPRYSEKVACEIIEKFKISWMLLGTSMANRFARYDGLSNYDLSSEKHLFTGGATMKRESQDALRKHLPHTAIIQAYGMTELGVIAAARLPDTTSGSCGVVDTNCEIKIIDPETGKLLGPNQNGELCAKTPTMMSGYYRNPEATKGIIDAEGWAHSGDLGYYNERGEIFVIDKLTEIIKYEGRQVPPSEIENVLQSHPAVLEAAVVSIPHPTDGEHPVAFVSKIQNKEVTAQELMDLVANNLMDHYKLRGGVKFMPSLPHTQSAKIARKELKAIAKTLAAS